MFEDFENRSGFWKDLGSNFTINYSGDAPSFLSSGEMWATMDGSETQTLAAWENGWVLTNNPDGTMTATPKYTSGLISQTLVRVPVGPQSPKSSPTGGVGGVQVAFSAENQTMPPLKEIYEKGHPFVKEFTISDSATGISWPDAKTLQITGHDGTHYTGSDYDPATGGQIPHYGIVVRIIPIDGYKVVVGGFESDGYGKVLPSYDLPYKREMYIISPDGTKYIPTQGGTTSGTSSSGTGTGDTKTGGTGGTGGPVPCADANRETNTDGSCAAGCKTDYEFDSVTGDCVAKSTSDDGEEEEDEGTNWLLWGGLAAVAALAFTM